MGVTSATRVPLNMGFQLIEIQKVSKKRDTGNDLAYSDPIPTVVEIRGNMVLAHPLYDKVKTPDTRSLQ